MPDWPPKSTRPLIMPDSAVTWPPISSPDAVTGTPVAVLIAVRSAGSKLSTRSSDACFQATSPSRRNMPKSYPADSIDIDAGLVMQRESVANDPTVTPVNVRTLTSTSVFRGNKAPPSMPMYGELSRAATGVAMTSAAAPASRIFAHANLPPFAIRFRLSQLLPHREVASGQQPGRHLPRLVASVQLHLERPSCRLRR